MGLPDRPAYRLMVSGNRCAIVSGDGKEIVSMALSASLIMLRCLCSRFVLGAMRRVGALQRSGAVLMYAR
jgi:hypothetical protein